MIEEKFSATIKEYDMISSGDRVLVGVSGGPDSVTLLHLLWKHSKILRCSLHVAHINHGLRGKDAEADARYVEKLCKKLKVPVTLRKVDVKTFAKENKLSIEDAGRRIRYEFYEEIAKEIGASRVALGHTADDNVETFLMRIVRGAGTRGLLGIPFVRGKIIRPLLKICRSEIEGYLRKKRIKPRTDYSNYSSKYLRNKIRLKIIPQLERINPKIKESILNTIVLLTADYEYLKSISEKTLAGIIIKRGSGYIKLDIDKLLMLPESILRYILRDAIQEIKGNLEEITYKHIAEIVSKLNKPKGFELHLPQSTFILSDGDILTVTSVEPKLKRLIFNYKLAVPGEVKIKENGYIVRASRLNWPSRIDLKLKDSNQAIVDFGKVGNELTIRNRRDGDKFSPFGMTGTKKLKDFFIDSKVPQDEKDTVPIVEGKCGITWVAGYRIDNRARITKKTKKALRLTLERL